MRAEQPPTAANDDAAVGIVVAPAPDHAAAWTLLAALASGFYIGGFTGSFALGAAVFCNAYLLGWMVRELLRRRRA
jgi:hypothetical protein